ncbi:hypothetical protein OIO90_005890 [Microbotryomycetes sp. JL221]|nr:hypothetical protein OIO90_005890 [Microbotryomycetes sp. JL221]
MRARRPARDDDELDDSMLLKRKPATTRTYGKRSLASGASTSTTTNPADDSTRAKQTTKHARSESDKGKQTSFRWSDSSDDDAEIVREPQKRVVRRDHVGRPDTAHAQSLTSDDRSDEHQQMNHHLAADDTRDETEWDERRVGTKAWTMNSRPRANKEARRTPNGASQQADARTDRSQPVTEDDDDDIPPPTPSKRKRAAAVTTPSKSTASSPRSATNTPKSLDKSNLDRLKAVIPTEVEDLTQGKADAEEVVELSESMSPKKRTRKRMASNVTTLVSQVSGGGLDARIKGTSQVDNNSKSDRAATPPSKKHNVGNSLRSPARDLSLLFQQFTSNPDKASNAEGKRPKRTASSLASRLQGRSKDTAVFHRYADDNQSVTETDTNDEQERSPEPSRARTPVPSPPRPGSPLTVAISPSGNSGSPVKINARPLSRMSSLNAEAATLAPRGNTGSKRTYGGSRSFKRDIAEEQMLAVDVEAAFDEINDANGQPSASVSGHGLRSSLLLPRIPQLPQERRSYSAMRSMLGIDQDEEDEDSLEASHLKSVGQLRAKGESSRFVDEFNYLMEGLQKDDLLSGRRAAALEILRKMLNKDFVRRLKSSGFDERVYNRFRQAGAGDGDRVLDSALAFLIVLLARDQRITEALCRISTTAFSETSSEVDAYEPEASDLLAFLRTSIQQPWSGEEIGAARSSTGLSKAELRYLSSLRDIIDQSKLLEPGTLSCKGLEARFIKYEKGLVSEANANLFLASALILCMAQNVLATDGAGNFFIIDLCLRVFEATTSATPLAAVALGSNRPRFVMALVTLVLACHIVVLDPDTGSSSDIKKTSAAALDNLLSALRMIIDLTTSDPEWSVALAGVPNVLNVLMRLLVASRTPDKQTVNRFQSLSSSPGGNDRTDREENSRQVADDDNGGQRLVKEDVKFDILCLALGALTNLVETVGEVQDALRTTTIDARCQMGRSCSRQCQCPGRSSALDCLTALYLDPLKDSTNELNKSFINGYAGITLGMVMLDNRKNQELVLQPLNKQPEAKARLVEALREFATLHRSQQRQGQSLHASTSAQSANVEGENDIEMIESQTNDYDLETARKIDQLVERLQRS